MGGVQSHADNPVIAGLVFLGVNDIMDGDSCGEWIMPKECVLVSTARRRNTTPARRSARGPRARPSASSGSRPLPPLSAYRTTPRNPFWRCGRCGSSRCATSYTVGANGARVPLSEQARAPLQLQPTTGRGLGPQRRGSLHGHPRAIRVVTLKSLN